MGVRRRWTLEGEDRGEGVRGRKMRRFDGKGVGVIKGLSQRELGNWMKGLERGCVSEHTE